MCLLVIGTTTMTEAAVERCTCATLEQWAEHRDAIMFVYDGCAEDATSCNKPKGGD